MTAGKTVEGRSVAKEHSAKDYPLEGIKGSVRPHVSALVPTLQGSYLDEHYNRPYPTQVVSN